MFIKRIKRTLLILSIPLVSFCANKDTIPPDIILNGSTHITLKQFNEYKEFGVTVTDNIDTEIKLEIFGEVDDFTLGEYNITYIATDKSGNTSSITRTITVIKRDYKKEMQDFSKLLDDNKYSSMEDWKNIGYYKLHNKKPKNVTTLKTPVITKEHLNHAIVKLTKSSLNLYERLYKCLQYKTATQYLICMKEQETKNLLNNSIYNALLSKKSTFDLEVWRDTEKRKELLKMFQNGIKKYNVILDCTSNSKIKDYTKCIK